MAERNISGADLAARHERGLKARKSIDMEIVRGMHFIPKNKDSWHQQYIYNSEDRDGNAIPLTGEKIDSFISPYLWSATSN